MKKIYFTITGMQFRYGSDFLERGDIVSLVKEPDNKYDKEAIRVEMDGLDLIGYVANSIHTVIGESYSAGRIYDRIKENSTGKVIYIFDDSALCELQIK
jgi:hypothetical protein